MQVFELNAEEVDVLREILQHELTQIDVEVFRTDSHEFKEMLKRRREILDHMLRKLSPLAVAA